MLFTSRLQSRSNLPSQGINCSIDTERKFAKTKEILNLGNVQCVRSAHVALKFYIKVICKLVIIMALKL